MLAFGRVIQFCEMDGELAAVPFPCRDPESRAIAPGLRHAFGVNEVFGMKMSSQALSLEGENMTEYQVDPALI